MSFSSRRRNYLLTPHRRDGLIEWMKSMLQHSFVLDALDTTGADTFSHFEMLIDEHREFLKSNVEQPSRLKQLVPTVGTFHTHLPLRRAFEAYNAKYGITRRRHVCISFNELRHILNLAQIMALRGGDGCKGNLGRTGSDDDDDDDERRALKRWEYSPRVLTADDQFLGHSPDKSDQQPPSLPPPLNLNGDSGLNEPFKGPKLITFDGDQTLYSDGANFESNPKLASYLYLLLRNGVSIAVVTAAGYEYQTEKYEMRLSGLLAYFKDRGLSAEDCERFYLFGGECNYLLQLGSDYMLHAVKEYGPGGWLTSTKYIEETPGNWDDSEVTALLDIAEKCIRASMEEQCLRARLIRKKRAVGLVPKVDEQIPREALDETILRVQAELQQHADATLPFCAFNGGRDAWVDCGNKRVGVQILQSYLGVPAVETLHIGDQFLNTGNDYAARETCPCIWITSPEETTYILKSILRLAGVSLNGEGIIADSAEKGDQFAESQESKKGAIDFQEIERRTGMVQLMDVYTGEITNKLPPSTPTSAKK